MRWNSRSKYHAVKLNTPDGAFDSKREYHRWLELKAMEKAGQIADLKRQVEFELIPEHREPDSIGPRGGIKKGKVIELKCCYVADFVYREVIPYCEDNKFPLVVEDSKGMRTPDYVIKRKLMLDRYGIKISEV